MYVPWVSKSDKVNDARFCGIPVPIDKQMEDIIGEQLHHGVDDIAINGVVTPPDAGSCLLWKELVL